MEFGLSTLLSAIALANLSMVAGLILFSCLSKKRRKNGIKHIPDPRMIQSLEAIRVQSLVLEQTGNRNDFKKLRDLFIRDLALLHEMREINPSYTVTPEYMERLSELGLIDNRVH